MAKNILAAVGKHKIRYSLIAIAVAAGGWYGYGKITATATPPQYMTALAEKGTLVASISGTGQVSASNQVDLKPQAAGTIVYTGAANGQEVKAGTLIVKLDDKDAQKSVRDAQANMDSAKLSLEKLKQPADTLSVIQAENTLARAKESKQNTLDNLAKAYENGFNVVSNAFLDLPTIIAGLQDTLYASNVGLGGGGQWNIDYYAAIAAQFDEKAYQYKTDVQEKYQTARKAYNQNFEAYKTLSRSSNTAVIESVIEQTYDTTKNMAEATKSANNLIQFYKDKLIERNVTPQKVADTHLASLNTYTGQTNTHLLNLLGVKNTISNDRDAIVNANRTITENTESLAKLKAGADPLDIRSSELAVTQRENALLDAKEKLADYSVIAPFGGMIVKMNVQKGDSASAGTLVATLITKQKLAQISLNEVDVAKVKIGQKTTLSFDAVQGLNITGEVVEIETVGTVTQGVVNYTVKINFDTQDDRIKPGMSTSAAVITNVKQDVLMILNSAVKMQGARRYVEIFNPKIAQNQGSQGIASATAPRQQTVEIGLSNDASTEIVSGLNEGDQVVTRTVSATAQTTTQTAPSLFGGGGGRGLGR